MAEGVGEASLLSAIDLLTRDQSVTDTGMFGQVLRKPISLTQIKARMKELFEV